MFAIHVFSHVGAAHQLGSDSHHDTSFGTIDTKSPALGPASCCFSRVVAL